MGFFSKFLYLELAEGVYATWEEINYLILLALDWNAFVVCVMCSLCFWRAVERTLVSLKRRGKRLYSI
jgi:hypothetical protein